MHKDIRHVYIIDVNGKIKYLSSAKLANKHNYRTLSDIIGYISQTEYSSGLEKLKRGEEYSFNLLTTEVSDHSKELFCQIKPLYDSNGEINYASVIVTDRKYEFLFNESNDAHFITDLKGNYLEVNSVATERAGILPEKFKKLSLLNVPGKQNAQKLKTYFAQIIEKGSAMQQIDYTNPKNELVSTEVIGKKITFEGKSAILHSSREVSVQKESHREILESIIHSEEEDRKFYASEILDNLGSILSLSKMYVDTYFDTDSNEIKNEIVDKLKSNLNKALKITTELTQRISPQLLTKFGVRPALHSFITTLAEEMKIKIRLTLDIPEKISENIDIVLYRAIVEIINYFVRNKCSAFINIDIVSRNGLLQAIMENNKQLINENIKPDTNYQIKKVILENRLKTINGEIEYQKRKNIDRVIIKIPLQT